MPDESYVLGEDAMRQIAAVVRAEMVRQKGGIPPQRGRWVKGGGAGCSKQNCKIQLSVFGSPTGGSFTVDITAGGTTTELTLAYDDTASEVATTLATHAEITSADVNVTGGPFPNATIEIEFQGDLANTDLPIPQADWSSLTGGSGVGVICSKTQIGH